MTTQNLPHTAPSGQQTKDEQLKIAEGVASAAAWSAVDEVIDYWQQEKWRSEKRFSVDRSVWLRLALHGRELYPSPFDPIWDEKPDLKKRVRGRWRKTHFAFIIDLMSRLSDYDLHALYYVAALLSVAPGDVECLANWREGVNSGS